MLTDRRVPFKYIFNKIKYDLAGIMLISLIVQYLTTRYEHFLPEMPINIPTFIGTAISVLLSFKISQSYDRWWEARKVWGAIVNDCRSMVLQLQSFLADKGHPAIRGMTYRQMAWCYSLGQSLRGQDPLEGLKTFLPEAELRDVARHNNKPLALLQQQSLQLRALKETGQLEVFPFMQLDATLVRLCDSMGKAERINSTVFPTTYRLFLHFFIYLFVVTLSISLKGIAIVYELPISVLLSIVFFLLEKTAFHLQDPFRNRPSDTSVTAIARNIEINLRQLLGETEVPEPVKPNGFYLM